MVRPRRHMATTLALSVVSVLVVLYYTSNNLAFMVHVDAARDQGSGQNCKHDEDCPENLFCNTDNKQCTDGPDLNSHQYSDKRKECKPDSHLRGTGHKCNKEQNAECCEEGKEYPRFKCSPAVTKSTKATLTVNDFGEGGSGGAESECDGRFHKGTEKVVALSTGWYAKGRRCGKKVRITLGGKSVEATVVDECDSFNGCDEEHSFQPPCDSDIVDASAAVWEALGVSQDDDRFGFTDITWTDA